MSADAVIVGAGIVGAACADVLSAEGMSVVVVEADVVGGGATAAGMGHIGVFDDSEGEFALTRYSCDLWAELTPELPADAGYWQLGLIWVAADDEEFEAARKKHAHAVSHGVRSEMLDARALAEAEPNLRPGLAGGRLAPGESVIYTPRVAKWMLDRALSRGARLVLGQRVTGIESGGVRLDDGTALAAGIVVLATGTLAPELVPGLPVTSKKGHVAITDRHPGFARHQLIELGYISRAHEAVAQSVAFNVQPRPTGQVMVGSSRQMDDASFEVDHSLLATMLRRAIEYMPGLAELSTIRTWTGHRAATPDEQPLIGPWPAQDGLYLATGHEGIGITASLGTARLLADHIAGRAAAIPIEPYLPERFCDG